ncbi:flagellar basal body-associated protein FliL [Pseudogulbenkiania sp. MAI-1]|uniref:flagellar basal body-associated protein FliL n=1 Tax=Pseudogulbenkiania sp. MAI-1 TaxID=990370 RepID=UPI00045E9C75|nr:flagellar basal body-associated protein FliL [Pseudogulbenkiania sp. MAI-1]
MNKKTIVVVILAMLLAVALGAGGVYWWLGQQNKVATAAEHGDAEKAEKADKGEPSRYVSLDKVIVMLRKEGDDSEMHYMAVDLVFRTAEPHEKELKEQLPFLKTVAVRALSQLVLARASAMSIDDYQQLLAKAYRASYTAERGARPFTEVMVGKLIIE